MPRKPREEVVDGIFHVYARGNDRRLIYQDDLDRRTYLQTLAASVERCRWRLLAFCLMNNHVHLRDYAQQFNERHGRSGHLFQGRYGSVPVKSDEQLWAVAAYIGMNPVEAGLCDAPERWPWSSHAAIVRGSGPRWLDVERLLEHFAGLGADPRARYAALFQEAHEARPEPGFAGGNSLVGSPRGASGVPSR